MIKELKKFQIRTTPFQAVKDWELNNTQNDGVILLEQTGSDGGDLAMALEYIDYLDGQETPLTTSVCDVALEMQASDRVGFREGKKLSGIFYPASDPQNFDGTYKRVVYSQIKTMFYNTLRNPTEIWGVENIDFDLSQTKRRIADQIKVFSIPSNVHGDKIIPGTITIHDRNQDNDYPIVDDGLENLVITKNLFTKVQEIGSFENSFAQGSDGTCNSYFNFTTGSPPSPTPPLGSLTLTVTSGSSVLSWSYSLNDETGFNIEKSLTGIIYSNLFTLSSSVSRSYTDTSVSAGNTYWYRVNAFNVTGTSSYSNTASISFAATGSSPSAPTNLTAVSGSAILNWNSSSSDQKFFTVQQSLTGSGGGYSEISTTTASVVTFTDTSVTSSASGSTYYYRVAAVNTFGTSSYSNTASITFTSAGGSGPDPLAWWNMEEATNIDRVDAVNGNHLQDFSQLNATITRDTGKIGFATKMTIVSTFFGSAADLETTTIVGPPDLTSGFHFVSWVAFNSWDANSWYYIANNTIDGPFVSLQAIWQSSTNEVLVVQDINTPNVADFTVSFTPTPGQFYFFNLFWDASDQKFGLQIDNGSITKSSVAVPIVGIATDIFVDILLSANNNLGNPSNAVIRVDNYGIYGKKLNSSQIDFLYNSGNGQSWPFSLPA